MGFMTLQHFRDELVNAVGGERLGAGTDRKDRYINMAYYEICGVLEFKDLMAVQSISAVLGTLAYSQPSDLLGVRAIIDQTNKNRLLKISEENYLMLDPEETGEPSRWTRYGGSIHIWPGPTESLAMKNLYIQQPATMPAGGSILPAQWDSPIWMLSCYYALLSLGDQHLSIQWFERAMAYLSSRITDLEYDADTEAEGIRLPQSPEELTQFRNA